MSGENTKNYREQDGERWVVGGELDVVGDGQIKKNGVPINLDFSPAANQAASTATDAAGLVTDFNALLTKLKAAGLMAAD